MLPAFIRNRIPLVLFALRDYYRIKSSKQSIFQKNRKRTIEKVFFCKSNH